jgi:hypothetical protein
MAVQSPFPFRALTKAVLCEDYLSMPFGMPGWSSLWEGGLPEVIRTGEGLKKSVDAGCWLCHPLIEAYPQAVQRERIGFAFDYKQSYRSSKWECSLFLLRFRITRARQPRQWLF